MDKCKTSKKKGKRLNFVLDYRQYPTKWTKPKKSKNALCIRPITPTEITVSSLMKKFLQKAVFDEAFFFET